MADVLEVDSIMEENPSLEVSIIDDKLDAVALSPETTRPTVTDFELLKLLGTGGFGQVFQVRKLNGEDEGKIFAMKAIPKAVVLQKKDSEHTISERNMLANLSSPFIVELSYAFQTEQKLYLVLEFLRGGEFFFRMETVTTFTEHEARFYLAELVVVLDYLHSNNIAYRDLKPDNIMIDEHGHIKLTDFGLCKGNLKGDGLTYTFCGTLEYMSPEMVMTSRQGHGHGKEVDLWSLGVLMHDMLYGNVPFQGESRPIIYQLILRGKIRMLQSTSEEARDFMRRLLTRNVSKRITCKEARLHPFFADVDWEQVESQGLEPPFVPKFKSPEDVSFFSTEFTNVPALDEPNEDNLENFDDDLFADFEYVADSI